MIRESEGQPLRSVAEEPGVAPAAALADALVLDFGGVFVAMLRVHVEAVRSRSDPVATLPGQVWCRHCRNVWTPARWRLPDLCPACLWSPVAWLSPPPVETDCCWIGDEDCPEHGAAARKENRRKP